MTQRDESGFAVGMGSDSDREGVNEPSRRRFLSTAALAMGAFALGCADRVAGVSAMLPRSDVAPPLPDPDSSGIEHVIVVMMENRSFDHFLGWLPGADGRQAGLTYVDRHGIARQTHPLAPDYEGCGFAAPDGTYAGGRVDFNGGACDGWLRAGRNDLYTIGYYQARDLPFLGWAAQDWTCFDRYFSSVMAETFPNRLYQHAGQSDRIHNTLALTALPTIWDRLAARGLTGRYYFHDLPFLALWGAKYIGVARSYGEFLEDCAAGTLPHVAFVDPRFLGEPVGLSGDDHPNGDIRVGEAFLNEVYTAVTGGPAWPNTVLVINFDEWGGFFDHVAPPIAPISAVDFAAGNDGRLGFRTPTVLISPFARRRTVDHTVYDHTSILRMIEWRWRLEPLAVRDDAANNLAAALNFELPDPDAPHYSVNRVVPRLCISWLLGQRAEPGVGGVSADRSGGGARGTPSATPRHWRELRDVARQHGWTT